MIFTYEIVQKKYMLTAYEVWDGAAKEQKPAYLLHKLMRKKPIMLVHPTQTFEILGPDPVQRQHLRELILSRKAGLNSFPVETWDEDNTQYKPVLHLDASTYRATQVFNVLPADRRTPNYVVSPLGTFCYLNAVLPQGAVLPLYGHSEGAV